MIEFTSDLFTDSNHFVSRWFSCQKCDLRIDALGKLTIYDYVEYDEASCHYESPELIALVQHCDQAAPVIDWLLEHATTPDQLELARRLETLVGEGSR